MDCMYRSTEIKVCYRNTEVQKYRSTEVQKYRSTEVQKSKCTEVHEYRSPEAVPKKIKAFIIQHALRLQTLVGKSIKYRKRGNQRR